jgi:hypothetical protein
MDEETLTTFLQEALDRSAEYASKSKPVLRALFLSVEQRHAWGWMALKNLGLLPLPAPERQRPSRQVWDAVEHRLAHILEQLDEPTRQALLDSEDQREVAYEAGYNARFGSPKGAPPHAPAPPPARPVPEQAISPAEEDEPDLDAAVEVDPESSPPPPGPPDSPPEDVVLGITL